MKTAARPSPAGPIALAAALLTALLVLVSPLSAAAHDSLIASSPEAGSTVDVLPAALTLTFSAKLIDGEGATEVVVTDATGASVTDGAATVDGAIVTQPLADAAAAGAYHVIWKIVSSDGHPTSGEFDFTVAASSAGDPTAPTTAPTTDPGDTTATASPSTATPTPEATDSSDEGSSASTWIWILSIAGVLVAAVAGVAAVALKGRGSGSEEDPEGDSDESTGR